MIALAKKIGRVEGCGKKLGEGPYRLAKELATLDRHAFSPVLGHSGGTLKLTKREEPCR